MWWLLRQLASLKLTLLGMILLGIGAVLSYGNTIEVSMWVLVVPLAILSINITAAIASNRRINSQPGLLLFHICLLLIVLLAGLGRLIHLDAHVELTEGQAFDAELIRGVRQGPWQIGDIDKVMFVQGNFTVSYLANLKRQYTQSEVFVTGQDGRLAPLTVGDQFPLLLHNYRFYTTFNKGFSPILSWIPESGRTITGSVNLPGYPLFDYKQANSWTPPGTQQTIKFWLQVESGLTREKPWVLDGRSAKGKLVVTVDDQRVELDRGGEIQLGEGRLRFEDLRTWMGYRIFYDPTIHWMVSAAFIGVLSLMQYFWVNMKRKSWLIADDDEIDNADGQSASGEVKAERV